MEFRLALLVAALLVGCESSPGGLSDALIASNDLQESAVLVSKAAGQGEASIPIFLTVLRREVSNRHSLLEIGKTNLCVGKLHALAQQGLHRPDEVPVLLKVIREQVAINDTLPTAETLKIITGLDVGYDSAFVERYTERDEAERLGKLEKWQEWSDAHRG